MALKMSLVAKERDRLYLDQDVSTHAVIHFSSV